MPSDTLNRYAPGGDIFADIEARYGRAAAEQVATAAESGESGAVAEALAQIRFGAERSESTLGEFGRLIATDPFGAPLASLNTGLGNVFGSFIRGVVTNPWVLAAVALAVYLWWKGRTR